MHKSAGYKDQELGCSQRSKRRGPADVRQIVAALLLLLFSLATTGCGTRRLTSAGGGTAIAPSIEASTALVGALSPEQALAAYRESSAQQAANLSGYSDDTTIEASLPSTSQHGQYWLKQTYSAPRSLTYRAVRFVGDGFVKNNVITRLLQSDVDRVEKGAGAKYAISDSNYRFSYRGVEELSGRTLYAFALRPNRKAPGLFRGRLLIDPYTGHIVRAAGRLSKSPSLWVKRVDFVQDYFDVGPFTLLAQVQSVAQARIVGKVMVDIRYSCYRLQGMEQSQPEPIPYVVEGSDDACAQSSPTQPSAISTTQVTPASD